MAIAFRAVSAMASGTTSVVVTTPASAQTNDVLVAFIADRATSGTTTAPSGWTRASSAVVSGQGRFAIFWAIVGVGGVTANQATTWSSLTTACIGAMAAYSGVNTTTPMDVTPTTRSNASGTTGSASVSAATYGAYVVLGFGSFSNGSTWSTEGCATNPTSGNVTERLDAANGTTNSIAIADGVRNPRTTGATGASSASMGTAGANGGSIVVLRPAAIVGSTTDGVTTGDSMGGVIAPISIDPTSGVQINHIASQTTLNSAAFSTAAGNRLIIAVCTGNSPSTDSPAGDFTVSGGGLSWSKLAVANHTTLGLATSGVVSVWWAYASSQLSGVTITATLVGGANNNTITMLIYALKGTTTSLSGNAILGAVSGTPSISFTTTANNSWVMAGFFNWTNDSALTVPAGQVVQGSFDDASSSEFSWLQSTASVTASSGTNVTINDTAPTGIMWSSVIFEIKVASGTVWAGNTSDGVTTGATDGGLMLVKGTSTDGVTTGFTPSGKLTALGQNTNGVTTGFTAGGLLLALGQNSNGVTMGVTASGGLLIVGSSTNGITMGIVVSGARTQPCNTSDGVTTNYVSTGLLLAIGKTTDGVTTGTVTSGLKNFAVSTTSDGITTGFTLSGGLKFTGSTTDNITTGTVASGTRTQPCNTSDGVTTGHVASSRMMFVGSTTDGVTTGITPTGVGHPFVASDTDGVTTGYVASGSTGLKVGGTTDNVTMGFTTGGRLTAIGSWTDGITTALVASSKLTVIGQSTAGVTVSLTVSGTKNFAVSNTTDGITTGFVTGGSKVFFGSTTDGVTTGALAASRVAFVANTVASVTLAVNNTVLMFARGSTVDTVSLFDVSKSSIAGEVPGVWCGHPRNNLLVAVQPGIHVVPLVVIASVPTVLPSVQCGRAMSAVTIGPTLTTGTPVAVPIVQVGKPVNRNNFVVTGTPYDSIQ